MSGSKLAFNAAPEAAPGLDQPASVQRPTARRVPNDPAVTRLPAASMRAAADFDESMDLGPDALAGTIGVVEAVFSSEQIAGLSTASRYTPMGPIGRGGMGRVDMVFDRALGRHVAKKTVLRRGSGPLLITEAQIGAQLEHPSLVPVYDVEIDDRGRPHYTMRVVRGRTLRDAIEARRAGEKAAMTLAQALGVLRQVCLAADYAHSRGVIHRDLKPENIIVGAFGEVYVLDWGVAFISPTSDLYRAGAQVSLQIAGTPGYMAPEQMAGGAIDARSDVFALGVILHEVLTGERPIDEGEETRPYQAAPTSAGLRRSLRPLSPPFDALVAACVADLPVERPASARLLADAIDQYLDGERVRAEREREADAHAAEGKRARDALETLDSEAQRLDIEAQGMLAQVKPWDPVERKQPAWERAEQADRLRSEAARALARAEAAFTRALGRVPDHRASRHGLAALYHRQFEAAEKHGDAHKMAQYMDLARAYDDGALAVQLRDEGLVDILSVPPGAEITVARYEQRGLVLKPEHPRSFAATPVRRATFTSGSYLVTARLDGVEIRYPVVVRRAHSHTLTLVFENARSVPEGMIFVPGGPFVALPPRESRMVPVRLPDFAIARFPVTFGQYVRFLDALSDASERERRTPAYAGRPLVERDSDGRWRLASHTVEGEGRRRIEEGRELELPVFSLSWFDAVAYARWMAGSSGRSYRLPTDLEWEKAARGADGRAFPMGPKVDPSLAKLRESRPEATQPEPVGAFVRDESPYGVRDLAGGVGDWTSTSTDGASLPELSSEGMPDVEERQAFYRGGSWGASTLTHMRYPTALRSRHTGVGFRLALDLDPEQSSRLEIAPLT
jgi:formylglycine-generating enzyme required for sulfatase activity